jgi:type 1 fimbriae regulatory protein FimB/type 1 fimbriae regulatory protein FimE
LIPGTKSQKLAEHMQMHKSLLLQPFADRHGLRARHATQIIDAARMRCESHRDRTMILLAFRHGLRAAELVALRWENADLASGKLYVTRVKNGSPSTHPLAGIELRALRKLQRETPKSPFIFVSERGAPLTRDGFRKMMARLGKSAGFRFGVHPHMLRHGTGYKLASQGVDTRSLQHYLGHKSIQHTVRYTELAADRFKGFWKD